MSSLIEILINADDRASGKMKNVADEGDNMGKIIAAGVTVASGALPALIGGLGATTALLGTAGIAAAGFGALAMTSITGVVETTDKLAQVQEKIDQAKQAGDAKALSAAYAEQKQILSGLTDEEKGAVTSLQDFKSNWKDMQDEMSPTTFTLMANGLNLTNNVMTKMFPAMKGVGDSFAGMVGDMNTAIESGKADAFFEHINTFAVPMFEMVMQSAGNVLKGLGNIMMAFTPLGMDMGNGLVDLTAKFASWSAGLQSSQGFQQFVTFVRTSTPVIMNIIGQLWNILVKLVTALAPLGLAALMLAQDFLTWANNSSMVKGALDLVSQAGTWMSQNMDTVKQVIIAVTAGFVAFKAALLIGSTITTVMTAVNGMRQAMVLAQGTTTALRTVTMLLNATLLANPLMWIAGLIAIVVAAGVLLYQNWDTVKAKAQEVWNKIKEMWAGIKQSWNEGVDAVKAYFNGLWKDAVQTATNMKNDVINKYNEIKAKATQAVLDMKQAVERKYLEIKQSAERYVLDMKQAVERKYLEIKQSAERAVLAMKNAVIMKYLEIKADATMAVLNMKHAIENAYLSMKNAISNAVSAVKTFVVNTWNNIKSTTVNIVTTMINTIVNFFREMPGKIGNMLSTLGQWIGNAFKNAMSSGKNAVVSGLNNIISTIKEWMDTFVNSGKGLLDSFTKGIKSGIKNAIGAVKDGMASIREFLPFSPAKKGPLSDLDKSGKAFFPTWYEAALTQVGTMQKQVGKAFTGVANEANVALGGTGLEAFTGGTTRVIVEHVVTGEVGFDGSGMDQLAQDINQTVIQTTQETQGAGMFGNRLRQSIQKY